MTKKQKRNSIASFGTMLFMGLVLLLLWFLRLNANLTVPETYIEIALGDDTEEDEEPDVQNTSAADTKPNENQETVQVAQEPEEEQEEVTEPTPPQPVIAKDEPDEVVVPTIDSTEIKKQQQAIENAQALAGSGIFGGEAAENPGGDDVKENPVKGRSEQGTGDRDKRIQGLGNRNLRDGKLPEPECEIKEGTVAVKIRVDANGNVKDASSANAVGTDIADKEFIKCVEDMLRGTKWTSGTGEAEGTITYNFRKK